MLDGRIDMQGTVKELQAQGVLKGIEHDAAVEMHKEALVAAETTTIAVEESPDATKALKKPRKLVKDEHREVGGVKWSIYKGYLKASSVFFPKETQPYIFDVTFSFCSSYWTWIILAILVVINQFWGITEKLWIKVIFIFIILLQRDIGLIDHLLRPGAKLMVRTTSRRCMPPLLLQRSSMKYPWINTSCITNLLIRIRAPLPYKVFLTLTGPAHRGIRSSTLEYMRQLVYYMVSVAFYQLRRNIRELCEPPASSSSELLWVV
jgi:hypothetical protein